jgi:hypothetical protein
MTTKHRITTPAANVYPFYIAKAEKKGRTKAEVDQILCWLTGCTPKQLEERSNRRPTSRRLSPKRPS